MPANLEKPAMATGLEKVSFHSNPKEGQCQKCSNYCMIALISHASKVILKILQAKLQQYVNHELQDVQTGFRNDRGGRDQIVNIHWITEKARNLQKNGYFCFIDYSKAFDYADHNKLWKILQEMGIPNHLNCLLINLYAGHKATVKTQHGTTDWFHIGKRVHQCYILSPYLISTQSTSCEISGWVKHNLESRLSGEISITSDTQMIPPLWQKVKRN